MLESAPIKQRFIEKFTSEFGLTDIDIQKSLVSFCMRDVDNIWTFAVKGLGLKDNKLESAINMFGNKHQMQAIHEVGTMLVEIFKASDDVKILAQSFTALMAQYNEKCIQTTKKKKRSP